jgi:16S rRNA (cytosine1402-N4)-methyltransferase
MPRKYHRKRREPRHKKDRSTPAGEHVPVMLAEVLAVLDPQPGQVFVDGTLGYAGHSAAILERLGPAGLLVATDLDADNLPRARGKLETLGFPFHLHSGNFAGIPGVLAAAGVERVDGLLADLGMSSMQVDDPERGFSFMRDGPLDMRMDRTRGRTAAELLESIGAEELAGMFTEFGDEPRAAEIAQAIVESMKVEPLATTWQLRAVIDQAAPVQLLFGPGHPPVHKQRLLPATRVFQALRIAVNRELANLSQLLRVIPQVLKPGGTAAIITFHSGEDRLVKAAFRDGLRSGIFSAGSDDPLRPSEDEKAANPRSRSAKLRWARLS